MIMIYSPVFLQKRWSGGHPLKLFFFNNCFTSKLLIILGIILFLSLLQTGISPAQDVDELYNDTASHYDTGLEAHKKKNYALALKEFRAGAAQGDRQSLRVLGLMHELGQGLPIDYAKAASFYHRTLQGAGKNWIISAKHRLADLYLLGKGVQKDPEKALQYYREIGDLWLEEYLNSMAWTLATTKEARYPDLAILFARRAAGGFDAAFDEKLKMNYTDTLAAAYAAAGRFRDAIQAQREAISLARRLDRRALRKYKARMRLYMRKRMLTCPGGPCD